MKKDINLPPDLEKRIKDNTNRLIRALDLINELYAEIESIADREGVEAKSFSIAVDISDRIIIQLINKLLDDHVKLNGLRDLLQSIHDVINNPDELKKAVEVLVIYMKATRVYDNYAEIGFAPVINYYSSYFGDDEAQKLYQMLMKVATEETEKESGYNHDSRIYG